MFTFGPLSVQPRLSNYLSAYSPIAADPAMDATPTTQQQDPSAALYAFLHLAGMATANPFLMHVGLSGMLQSSVFANPGIGPSFMGRAAMSSSGNPAMDMFLHASGLGLGMSCRPDYSPSTVMPRARGPLPQVDDTGRRILYTPPPATPATPGGQALTTDPRANAIVNRAMDMAGTAPLDNAHDEVVAAWMHLHPNATDQECAEFGSQLARIDAHRAQMHSMLTDSTR
jgi:hypothetical protein